ncbi:hypothetical protein H4219_003470 [Mycoemilia scoparia]|uniref:UFSP1/2/DUB catalytic domain-containing protein n=1 Tax=Mycoemilia scoparia TaxID=417184 RepID=A0A9W8A0D3_9FUNG|nr:hypothetical protein H4219_003470 [Mycoemilia scoparia]
MEVKESKKGSVDTLRNALELQSILAKRSKRASKSVPDNGDDDDLTKDSDVPKPHLCIGDTRYFGSDPNDFGWGCGYRNCQMILSSLQAIGHPLFSKHGSIFDNDSGKSLENVPSINGLQQILEKAWKEVGISQEENLLVFDPNLSLPLDEIGIIKEKYGTEKTNIRQKQIERDLVRLERLVRARNMLSPRDISSHQQYQILWVYTDGVVSEEDKNIVSSRVP